MKGLLQGLRRSKERLLGAIERVISRGSLDAATLEELEEVLLGADMGVEATERIVNSLREKSKREDAGDDLRGAIARELIAIIEEVPKPEVKEGSPRVIVIVGVNGVGKTSTIGKLAHRMKCEGKTVLLAACDTFRAAAIEQLELWGERAGVPVVHQKMGADPAAVAFDAVQSARARGIDVVIADTAGRLHTKVNLMEELKKIFNVLSNRMPGIGLEGWLVLDANIGQNSLRQAEVFASTLPLTGLVLTKLDGTAKGGAVVAIQQKLKIPVLYIGVGEKIEDLEPFDAGEFVSGILGE